MVRGIVVSNVLVLIRTQGLLPQTLALLPVLHHSYHHLWYKSLVLPAMRVEVWRTDKAWHEVCYLCHTQSSQRGRVRAEKYGTDPCTSPAWTVTVTACTRPLHSTNIYQQLARPMVWGCTVFANHQTLLLSWLLHEWRKLPSLEKILQTFWLKAPVISIQSKEWQSLVTNNFFRLFFSGVRTETSYIRTCVDYCDCAW